MSTALFDLSGRTALVTGSSRGLGRAIAEGMAKAGARIIVNGFDPNRVEQVVAEFRAAGYLAEGAAFNVTDEPAIVAAFNHFDNKGIAVDILVNNAGIQHRKPLVEFTTDEWRKVIETNLTSAFVIGREAAKRMIPRKHGKIINIGSLGSELARPTIAPYTAAKGGIKNLTRSMAVEWAQHGIQANAIGPGYMLTDMNEALVNNTRLQQLADGPRSLQALGPAGRAGGRCDLPGLGCIDLCQRPDHLCRWRHDRRYVKPRNPEGAKHARRRHSRTERSADR
ncbi:gluconate 5-dehydrogenase [Bradyrhizobium sp. F1.13.4]